MNWIYPILLWLCLVFGAWGNLPRDASEKTLINETRFVYDGRVVLQERNVNNSPVVTYTRGLDLSSSLQGAGGIGGLLARTDSGGSAYYHTDLNGNITALVNSKQDVVARYLYSPFGKLLASSGSLADANRYRFSSKEHHAYSGMYYFGFRFYEPNYQRWLNRDPLGEAGGLNLYGFVGNTPINRSDPDGLAVYQYGSGEYAGLYGPAPYVYGETVFERYITAPLVNTISTIVNVPSAFGGFLDYLSDKSGLSALFGARPTEVVNGIAPAMLSEATLLRAQNVKTTCKAAESGTTPLWRAVKPEELADIQAQGIFRNLGSAEGKYFSTTAEGAASYAKQAVKGFGDPPYTLIKTEVPNNLLPPSVLVDRNVPAVVLPNNVLPNLKPQVLDYFPFPPR